MPRIGEEAEEDGDGTEVNPREFCDLMQSPHDLRKVGKKEPPKYRPQEELTHRGEGSLVTSNQDGGCDIQEKDQVLKSLITLQIQLQRLQGCTKIVSYVDTNTGNVVKIDLADLAAKSIQNNIAYFEHLLRQITEEEEYQRYTTEPPSNDTQHCDQSPVHSTYVPGDVSTYY